jgi:hypothetical protein
MTKFGCMHAAAAAAAAVFEGLALYLYMHRHRELAMLVYHLHAAQMHTQARMPACLITCCVHFSFHHVF